MQHSYFLWWVSIVVLALTSGVTGDFCTRVARHYDSRIRLGHSPDTTCLTGAVRTALATPVVPIIWADDVAWWPALVNVVTGMAIFTGFMLYRHFGWGLSFALFSWVGLVLLLLACIDARTGLLPDALTLPLLWVGVAVAWAGWNLDLHDSIAGVVLGYGLLAVPRLAWLWGRGVDGVGAGDVKLLAALGAWIGASAVVQVLTAACVAGVIFAMIHQRRWRPSGAYAFGPFIIIAAWPELLCQSGVHSWF